MFFMKSKKKEEIKDLKTRIENLESKIELLNNTICIQERILKNFKDGEVTFEKEFVYDRGLLFMHINKQKSGMYFYRDRKEYFVKGLILCGRIDIYNVDKSKIYLHNTETKNFNDCNKIIEKKVVVDILKGDFFVLEENEKYVSDESDEN